MNHSFFAGKSILVTGGTGSIGSEIVRQLLAQKPRVVRIYSRGEHKQFMMQRELADRDDVRFLLGDVRDLPRLETAMEGIDYVFHAAAYKHVPSCEYNSFEAVKTNVIGTQNIIDAAQRCGVERVLLVSTDKAVSPLNVMGATKLLGEKLMTSAMHSKGGRKTIFSSVRFGNVLGSRGSVVPIFVSQVKKGGPVTITDPNMSRFFMTIQQAVHLTLSAVERMEGGEVFILKMPLVRLEDLADAIIERFGNGKTIEKKIVGVRIGEKMDEVLMNHDESQVAEELEDMYVVHALQNIPGEASSPLRIRPANKLVAASTALPISKEQIRSLLEAVTPFLDDPLRP